MRSSNAGALLWRIMSIEDRLKPEHSGSRKLRNLTPLVMVRCQSAQPKPHELAYVYKIPGDVITKMRERHHAPFMDGSLLFVSADNETFVPGHSWTHQGEEMVDNGDLLRLKEERRERNERVITPSPDSGRRPYKLTMPVGLRRWAPLVDLLDYKPDDDREHAELTTRCRCGQRPSADRHELIRLAREAQADGKMRRVFV